MKKKHKLLVVLSCIPLLISCLILPLCSFTTVYNDTSYDVYSSRTKVSVPYIYKYGSSGFYYGNIYNACSVLVPTSANTIIQKNNGIRFVASDYYITSSTRIRTRSFSDIYSDFKTLSSLDPVPPEDPNYLLNIIYHSTNTNAYIGNTWYFENYHLGDDVSVRFLNSDLGYIDMSSNDYKWSIDISFQLNYWEGVDENYTFATRIVNYSEDLLSLSFQYYNFNNFLDAAVYESFEMNLDDFIYYEIPRLTVILIPYRYDSSEFAYVDASSEFAGVVVTSKVINTSVPQKNITFLSILEKLFSDEGPYEKGYNDGYSKGYNAGISNIDSVWPELGDFLHNSVTAFLDVELFSGFTISTVLGIFVGATLLITFLKLFAGG